MPKNFKALAYEFLDILLMRTTVDRLYLFTTFHVTTLAAGGLVLNKLAWPLPSPTAEYIFSCLCLPALLYNLVGLAVYFRAEGGLRHPFFKSYPVAMTAYGLLAFPPAASLVFGSFILRKWMSYFDDFMVITQRGIPAVGLLSLLGMARALKVGMRDMPIEIGHDTSNLAATESGVVSTGNSLVSLDDVEEKKLVGGKNL